MALLGCTGFGIWALDGPGEAEWVWIEHNTAYGKLSYCVLAL